MINVEHVSWQVRGKPIVQDVSFTVKPGQVTVILGPNGAGKSSLLGLVSGLIRPTSGQIWLEEQPLARLPPAKLAEYRAVVEQHPAAPVGWTTAELIQQGALAGGHAPASVTDRAMALTCTTELAAQSVQTLSGGERQRAHIARALCQLLASPQSQRYLLLDEPTAALDFAMADGLLAQVVRLSSQLQIGVLAVVHDLNLALRYADEVLLMHKGRAVGVGPTVDIMQKQRLEAIYGMQLAELHSPDGKLRAFLPATGTEPLAAH